VVSSVAEELAHLVRLMNVKVSRKSSSPVFSAGLEALLCWCAALCVAGNFVEVDRSERIQLLSTLYFQKMASKKRMMSLLTSQASGRVDIINTQDGMDLINFHFHSMLNQ